MKQILLSLTSPSGKCELLPHYDKEANILEVSSIKKRQWPYGIDIDGNIIFDIDANFKLANFDLLISKKLWKQADQFPRIKHNDDLHDIIILEESLNHKSFTIPLKIITNKKKSEVWILIDYQDENFESYSLSTVSNVLVEDKKILRGFHLLLSN